MDALIERVWAGAREPENPSIIIRVRTHDLRAKLHRYGWTIPASRGGRGKPGLYKLEPCEMSDEPLAGKSASESRRPSDISEQA